MKMKAPNSKQKFKGAFRLVTLCLVFMFSINLMAQDIKIKVNQKGKAGYVSSAGKEILPCKYDAVSPFENGLGKVRKGEEWGVVDANGKFVIPIKYKSIIAEGNIFKIKDGKKYGLVGRDGKVLLKPDYTAIYPFNSKGLAIIVKGGKMSRLESNNKPYISNGKLGVINAEGKILIQPKYSIIKDYNQDLNNTKLYREGKMTTFGAINFLNDTLSTDGPYFGFNIGYFDASGGLVELNSGKDIIKQGKHTFILEPVSGMARWYDVKNKKYSFGYYNLSTKKDIEIDEVKGSFPDNSTWVSGDFFGDLAPVCVDGVWKFIDKKGKTVLSGYDSVIPGRISGFWGVLEKGKAFLVDGKGNTLWRDKGFEDMIFPHTVDANDFITIKKNGKWGVVDKAGNVKVDFKYDQADGVRHGWCVVKIGDKIGVVTVDGELRVPIEFDGIVNVSKPRQRYVWVQKGVLYYAYDIINKELLGDGYLSVDNFEGDYAWVRPQILHLKGDIINLAQVGIEGPISNGKKSTISVQEQFEKQSPFFGYIIGKDFKPYFAQPIYILKKKDAVKAIENAGNRPLTEQETRKAILDITANNRKYPLAEKIASDNWDY